MLPLLIVFSYLMGSIPTGYILVKKKLNKDVRDYGSGNIGATNVKRIAGEKLFLHCLLLYCFYIYLTFS